MNSHFNIPETVFLFQLVVGGRGRYKEYESKPEMISDTYFPRVLGTNSDPKERSLYI